MLDLSEDNLAKLLEIQKLKYMQEFSLEWLANHAVENYHRKKMDSEYYKFFRATQTKRRLTNQGWKCYWEWCQRPLTPETATLDHLVPKVHGGVSEGWNLVVSCEKCNLDKGDLTEEEFRIANTAKRLLMRPKSHCPR